MCAWTPATSPAQFEPWELPPLLRLPLGQITIDKRSDNKRYEGEVPAGEDWTEDSLAVLAALEASLEARRGRGEAVEFQIYTGDFEWVFAEYSSGEEEEEKEREEEEGSTEMEEEG